MAPVENMIAVVLRARLDAVGCPCQMQLAGQATVVASIGQQPGDQRGCFGPAFVAVHAAVDAAGIHAGQKTGPAGGADRALAEGVAEGNPFSQQLIDVGCVNMWIAQRSDRVIALLVGTNPENIRFHIGHISYNLPDRP